MTRGTREGGNARLSKENVQTIRQRYEAGATQRELCRVYGVSITTIGRIVRGETWGWLEGAGNAPEAALDRPLPPLTPEQEQAALEAAERIKAAGGTSDS